MVDSNGNKSTSHIIAYKGRVFSIIPEDFDDPKQITVDAKAHTIEINASCEVQVESYLDPLGVTKKGLRLKPKCGLDLAAF